MFISDTPTESQWASLDTSDHSSRAWSILLVNGMFVGVVVVVIFLRLWTKIFMITKLSSDDCKPSIRFFTYFIMFLPVKTRRACTLIPLLRVDFMMASALCFWVFCALNISATNLGFGRHIWDLPGTTESSTPAQLSEAAAPAQRMNFISLALASPMVVRKFSTPCSNWANLRYCIKIWNLEPKVFWYFHTL